VQALQAPILIPAPTLLPSCSNHSNQAKPALPNILLTYSAQPGTYAHAYAYYVCVLRITYSPTLDAVFMASQTCAEQQHPYGNNWLEESSAH
jgi:hypothetical protein